MVALEMHEMYAKGTQYLHDLCNRSGGRHFDAATVPSLREAFSQIAEELRHQYTLCYYPSSPGGNGANHRIRVEATRPDIRLRARPGYRAGTKPGAAK